MDILESLEFYNGTYTLYTHIYIHQEGRREKNSVITYSYFTSAFLITNIHGNY